MRKRQHKYQVWLNDEELALVENARKKSGLSGEAYIRSIIHGYHPKELPSVDYYNLLNKIYKLNDRLEYVANIAANRGGFNIAKLKELEMQLQKLILEIQESFSLPEKIKEV